MARRIIHCLGFAALGAFLSLGGISASEDWQFWAILATVVGISFSSPWGKAV